MNWDIRDDECSEFGQAAAYVLRALESHEADSYEEHLHGCPLCTAEVSRLQPVVDALPSTLPHLSAATELSARVMASVRSEAQLLRAAGASADRPERERVPRRPRRPEFLVAAVALGVGLLIGAMAIGTGSKVASPRVTSAIASAPAGAHAIVHESAGRAELVVTGIAQPPAGKIYEVWLAHAGGAPRATNALFGVTRGGNASVSVPGNIAGVHQVLVTAEPLGGSTHPTSTPIIVATLPS
ncbi:MAG TPA: anti-sigma factor [Solirubrobacteraceae bacterium]|jgi:anti-sigma-K factor RskA